MANRKRAFLDTSALFAGIWSSQGGARLLLKLGEAQAIDLIVSSQVLAELEGALKRKAPGALGSLALLLDRSNLIVVPPADADLVETCQTLTHYRGDALVLAAAWAANPDYFVTLDKQHFLENRALREAIRFPLGTPGDFLAWLRGQLSAGDSLI